MRACAHSLIKKKEQRSEERKGNSEDDEDSDISVQTTRRIDFGPLGHASPSPSMCTFDQPLIHAKSDIEVLILNENTGH